LSFAAEHFSALTNLPGLVHAFSTRVPGIEVWQDKVEARARLDRVHRELRAAHGLEPAPFITAQQVHGSQIAIVDEPVETAKCFAGCDGLITNRRSVCLGIYVADCCAVFLVDPKRHAIGLVHSGKKGTELGIVPNAIKAMTQRFASLASDIVVQLSPCIRPPHYEIDFASEIVRQCRELGVDDVHDCSICTACDLQRYYSYRAEKGRTGRMLAVLALPDYSSLSKLAR